MMMMNVSTCKFSITGIKIVNYYCTQKEKQSFYIIPNNKNSDHALETIETANNNFMYSCKNVIFVHKVITNLI